MSLFDMAKSKLESSLVSGLLEQHGGVQGLVDQLHRGGLGEIARSWVGTGPNLPISAQQIQGALGSGILAKLAASAGIDPAKAAEQISKVLPAVIDKLTPQGTIPSGLAPESKLSSIVSGLFSEGGTHV